MARNLHNLHKFYYRDYFDGIKFSPQGKALSKIKGRNNHFLQECNQEYLSEALKVFDSINHNSAEPYVTSFILEVCYPGLVTGIGINHEAKVEGEFKLGIHLDYTTGLPIIYGSSVKGVLRSAFQEDDLLDVLPRLVPPKLKEELKPVINKMKGIPLKELADAIFGDDDDRDSRSVYERDVFFDAIVFDTNSSGRFLAVDSITPHGNNPFKNPIPLTFVRIASGCKIQFRFRLTGDDEKPLTAKDKITLFKAILIAFGIGAKTNVGYGRLEDK